MQDTPKFEVHCGNVITALRAIPRRQGRRGRLHRLRKHGEDCVVQPAFPGAVALRHPKAQGPGQLRLAVAVEQHSNSSRISKSSWPTCPVTTALSCSSLPDTHHGRILRLTVLQVMASSFPLQHLEERSTKFTAKLAEKTLSFPFNSGIQTIETSPPDAVNLTMAVF